MGSGVTIAVIYIFFNSSSKARDTFLLVYIMNFPLRRPYISKKVLHIKFAKDFFLFGRYALFQNTVYDAISNRLLGVHPIIPIEIPHHTFVILSTIFR